MEATREEVLKGWLKLSLAINNERLVSGLPYNEFLICGILYRNQKSETPGSLRPQICASDEDSEIPDESDSEQSGEERTD